MSKKKFNALCAKYDGLGWVCTLKLANVAVYQSPIVKTTFVQIGRIGG